MSDEKLDAVIDALTENTTTLGGIGTQSAKTARAMTDARTYIQTVARNTDWEKNSNNIALVFDKILKKDRTALNASAEAATKMRGLSVELTSEVRKATDAMNDKSGLFDHATDRLIGLIEAHHRGRWRRIALTACIGLLCGAVGFYARDTSSNLIFDLVIGRGYGESIWYKIAPLAGVGLFCGIVGFFISKRV
jgi:ElaB/YqjD/DUF883 family membrane-anchored ribosome-binding protein